MQSGEPTMQQLTDILTSMAHHSEQLHDYDKRAHQHIIISPKLEKVMGIYKDLYMSHVNACQQALISCYLCKPQPSNALAKVIPSKEEDNDEADEVLADLQQQDIPMDFEEFDVDVTHGDGCGDSDVKDKLGGSRKTVHNQPSKPGILTRQTKQFTDSLKISMRMSNVVIKVDMCKTCALIPNCQNVRVIGCY